MPAHCSPYAHHAEGGPPVGPRPGSHWVSGRGSSAVALPTSSVVSLSTEPPRGRGPQVGRWGLTHPHWVSLSQKPPNACLPVAGPLSRLLRDLNAPSQDSPTVTPP